MDSNLKSKSSNIKCDWCGKFIAKKELEYDGRARLDFEPDSAFGPEICGWICPDCVEKYKD